ncbi:hypothetical protein CY34DRAFT_808149 [Suillus luteus UH-Slu-Lm8-n1]|uniref:Uncharacterized protein n=1 Tax=Suillus luteus UH-Slu-Lm8-n1 TaxID=930992 RepID=A0A0D0AD12_9AGAM|nr:hypothetical protein CY34DRAFT_808149 [Suillus luteus UH-Slu-Lm8-n1]
MTLVRCKYANPEKFGEEVKVSISGGRSGYVPDCLSVFFSRKTLTADGGYGVLRIRLHCTHQLIESHWDDPTCPKLLTLA